MFNFFKKFLPQNLGASSTVDNTTLTELTEIVNDKLFNYQVIKSVSDFPTPVGDVITLADYTTYLINGTVDIGTNRIEVGIKNTITGLDRQNDILTSSTTGTMFTMDNSVTPKQTLIFDNLTLKATAGTLISATGGSTDQVTFITVTVSETLTGGTFSGVAFSMRTSSLSSAFSVGGFTFTGTNQAITLRDSTVSNNTGTAFDATSATFSTIRMSRNYVLTNASQTFLNATTVTLSIGAEVGLNIFSGAGTHFTGITAESAGWLFIGNTGLTNTLFAIADTENLQSTLDGKSSTSHNHTGVYQPVPTGTPDGSKFLRDDNTWQAPPGGGSGLTQPQVMARALGV